MGGGGGKEDLPKIVLPPSQENGLFEKKSYILKINGKYMLNLKSIHVYIFIIFFQFYKKNVIFYRKKDRYNETFAKNHFLWA